MPMSDFTDLQGDLLMKLGGTKIPVSSYTIGDEDCRITKVRRNKNKARKGNDGSGLEGKDKEQEEFLNDFHLKTINKMKAILTKVKKNHSFILTLFQLEKSRTSLIEHELGAIHK